MRIPYSADDCTNGEHMLVHKQLVKGYIFISANITKQPQPSRVGTRIRLFQAETYGNESMTVAQIETLMVQSTTSTHRQATMSGVERKSLQGGSGNRTKPYRPMTYRVLSIPRG